MSKLAINGGSKVREKLFPPYRIFGEQEAKKAYQVVQSGILSKYLGCWDPDFFGGPEIQSFEKQWAEHFKVKHAITVNSNTTGLFCALGALNIGPGDEVIVSPYSMSISASAPLFYGAIPIFADIEEEYFCIDPVDVEKKITARTKAIIAVDIFGQPFSSDLVNLARKHHIPIIEDTAQAPHVFCKNQFAGTLGTLGVFSLNYHKHIHTGEGGVIVTNDDDLATRCRLIRNHAEAVVDNMNYQGSLINMIGLNFRLGEIEASLGQLLLKKLPDLVEKRAENVHYLESALSKIDFLTMPKVRSECSHAYYMHAIKFDQHKCGVSREQFVDAVSKELPLTTLRESEGVLMGCGYVKPLYLQSLYQKKIGFGQANYPFDDPANKSEMNYDKGICPVTESMHYEKLFTHEFMRPGMEKEDLDDVITAFHKVAEHINELK